MKLLVISHACVTPINQAFFVEVERHTGWDVTMMAPARWKSAYGGQLRLERWPDFKGTLVPLPVWKSGSIPLHVYRTFLGSLLRRINPDAIYMHHEPYAAATAQVYMANRMTINRPIGFFTWQNIVKRYPIPFRQLERMVFRQSHYALSGSHVACSVLREKRYDGPVAVIPAGIDPNRYGAEAGDKNIAHQLRDSPGEVLIGFMGRIVEEKGLATLLHALVPIQHLPWRLVVIGAGPFERSFDELAASLGLSGRIKRLGYVPHTEAPDYLAAFDMLVLPSESYPHWKEQFGRVIIEAMAAGTPVVGSDSGEIPNLIRNTGGGLVFPEGRAEQCTECLAMLIQNPQRRRELAAEGRRAVLQTYTHSALAIQFANVIEQAVGSAPSSGR